MAATLDISCPHCAKAIKLPAELVGKTIRCKGCQQTFTVGGAKAAKPAMAKPSKPAKAVPPPADAIPFKEDEPAKKPPVEEDDEANPYGVVKDDTEIPRCPFCAKELDPPDTKVCLNCGFHLTERRRRESKAVWEPTTEDYISHLGPAIGCIVAILVMIGLDIYLFLNMREWLTGSFVDLDEKNIITGETTFIVGPLCFNLWIGVISAGLGWFCGKFAFVRLVYNSRPPERIIKR